MKISTFPRAKKQGLPKAGEDRIQSIPRLLPFRLAIRIIFSVSLLTLAACRSTRTPISLLSDSTSPPPGSIHSSLPDFSDSHGQFVFYLHGKLIEDQGTVEAASPEFGPYEYLQILDYLAGAGYTVISEPRTSPTDGVAYAQKVAAQVEALLERGVPPKHITIIGFSKGGGIAILTSAQLMNQNLKYVFIAICHDEFDNNHHLLVSGKILSLFEETDPYGHSCQILVDRSPEVTAFEEIKLSTGKKHGAFYKADPLWLDPVIVWVNGNPR